MRGEWRQEKRQQRRGDLHMDRIPYVRSLEERRAEGQSAVGRRADQGCC